MPVIMESHVCCQRFSEKFKKITGNQYNKNDRYLYKKLIRYGNEENAIRLADQCYRKCEEDGKLKPSKMWPASRVQYLVEEIRKKFV